MRDHTQMEIDCSSRKKNQDFLLQSLHRNKVTWESQGKGREEMEQGLWDVSKLVNMCITCYATFSTAACFKFSSE